MFVCLMLIVTESVVTRITVFHISQQKKPDRLFVGNLRRQKKDILIYVLSEKLVN